MDQKCLPSWRNPARYPTSPDADAFVHASHLMGGVHQRGGRRAAHRAAHRGAVGPERSGRSILKLTSLCRCAGPQEAAFCVLRAMRHRGCYGIGGRVFEHRARQNDNQKGGEKPGFDTRPFTWVAALPRRAQTMCSAATMAPSSTGGTGTLMPTIRLTLEPSTYSPRRCPFRRNPMRAA